MPARSRQVVSLLVYWVMLVSTSMLLVGLGGPNGAEALGGNNIFGIFRKRRLALHHVQELREAHAERNGFAGPHGQALTGDQAQELLDLRRAKGSSPFKPLGDWIQQRLSSTSSSSGEGGGRQSESSKD